MGSTILVIDDDKTVHCAVEEQLGSGDTTILGAMNPLKGIQLAMSELPDLILLDVNMPQMDGLKVCRHLKEGEETRDIPVVFITVNRDAHQIAKALDCGGSDYIRKPFEPVELQARVRASLRTKRMMDLLKVQARIDGLTGLKNRAALDDAIAASISAYQRMDAPMSLMMIDVDHFKAVNDRYGHGVGDDVLRRIGDVIQATCRPYDTACRFGGDEFAVIFGQTPREQAELAARRLLSEIGSDPVSIDRGTIDVSVSAGLAPIEHLQLEVQPAELLKAADSALYDAKEAGRSRMVTVPRQQG